MSLISRMRRQDAVYWPPQQAGRYGLAGLGQPVAVRCRWDDVHEQYVTTTGTTTISNAKVYVDQDMLPGGYLWLGLLADLPDSPTDPRQLPGAYEIQKLEKIGNLRATEFLRIAML